MSKVFERVQELEKLIPYYAENYYSGNELISDQEFDKLTEELEELNPNSEILKKTGWGAEEYGQKYNHKYQLVGSLNKTREWEGLPDKFKQNEILLSQKLDGLSAVVQYENGKLTKALTRGNGKQGLDITSKLKAILKYDTVGDNFTGEVRGELIMPQSNWEKVKELNLGLRNSRNAVAGVINSKNPDKNLLEMTHYVVYKVTGSENKNFKDLEEIRNWLKLNFEHVVKSFKINKETMSNKEMWDFQSNEFYTKIFPKDDYQIDGIVLSLNNIEKQENGAIICDEFAYKFQSEIAKTTVKGIKWELSKANRMKPVIQLESVEILETNVSQATGNNAKFVKNLKVGIGAEVEIEKKNEIIPAVVNVLKPVEVQLPEICPVCRSKLEWDGVDLVCANPNCENLSSNDLKVWTDNVGAIDTLAWVTKNKYFEENNIETIEQLHNYINGLNDMQLGMYTSITDNKMLKMYNKLQTNKFKLSEILVALNIPRLGGKTADKIENNKDAYEIILKLSKEETISGTIIDPLTNIVGPATTESILENSEKLKRIHLLNLEEKDWSKVEEKKEVKGTFCITGKLEKMKRNDLVKLAEEKGWQFIGSVNKDCQYLVTNTPNSGSSKNKKAQELGTKLVTENEFYEMIEK